MSSKPPRYGVPDFDRRTTKRAKVFEPATLDVADCERRCHILDISRGGALLHAQTPPQVGQVCTLRTGGSALKVVTVWVEDQHFGVAFVVPAASNVIEGILASKPTTPSAVK